MIVSNDQWISSASSILGVVCKTANDCPSDQQLANHIRWDGHVKAKSMIK